MPQHWLETVSFLSIYALAIIVPGANFAMVLNTALTGSRQASVLTALGIATGSGLFALAGLFGFIIMINTIPYFQLLIGILGGGYLLYAGGQMLWKLWASPSGRTRSTALFVPEPPLSAYRAGLITNLTNPKAWAFYISLFTIVLTADFTFWTRLLLGATMFLISFAWYGCIALLATSNRLQPTFERGLPAIQGFLGCLLIWLGGRLIFS